MELNREQREVVGFGEGVLQVVAGPGTGKTEALVNRVVELLKRGAPADSIMMVTFTRKAAEEFYVRLLDRAQKEGVDPLGVYCGTLHSLCFQIMEEFGYSRILEKKLIEDFGKRVLLYDLFVKRGGFSEFSAYFSYVFGDDWIKKDLKDKQLFGKIEALIERLSLYSPDLEKMERSENPAAQDAVRIYRIYESFLNENNFIDFNGVEKLFLEFLKSEEGELFLSKIEHLLVDEYQDTNPLDEEIYFEIASRCGSFVVVGDEDQSLFSFRGATVRSFINFEERVKKRLKKPFKRIFLTKNYRSVKDIIDFLNYYISQFPELERIKDGEKLVHCGPKGKGVRVEYLRKATKEELAEKCAEIIKFLREEKKISKYSDAVLLVPSAREEDTSFVKKLKDELRKRKIKVYNQRSRRFGEKEHVKELINLLKFILGSEENLPSGFDERQKEEIEKIRDDFLTGKSNLLQAYYRVVSLLGYLDSGSRELLFDISHLSQFISQFEEVYGKEELKEKFSSVFVDFIKEIDEPEIPPEFLPEDHFPIMTIHQAKGLEFPVVFVAVDWLREEEIDRVNDLIRPFVSDEVRELLPPPEDRETVKRKLYVAFSRAEQLLIILDGRENVRKGETSSIYPGGDEKKRRAYRKEKGKLKLGELRFEDFAERPLKGKPRLYSFTGDIASFLLCPRLYGLRKFYGFASSSAVQEWFGTAIHRTLRQVYIFFKKNGRVPDGKEIEELFETVRSSLRVMGVPEPEEDRVEKALSIVKKFVKTKGEDFYRKVVGAELPISVKKEDFYLKGVIDVLLSGENGLEIWDFKSMRNPEREGRQSLLEIYEKQLRFYAMILSQQRSEKIGRLVLCFLNEYLDKNPMAERGYEFNDKKNEKLWEWVKKKLKEIEGCKERNRWLPPENPDKKTCLACDFRFGCPVGKDIIQAS